MGMTVVDEVNGLLVAGVWLSIFLYAFQWVQTFNYVRSSACRNDGWGIRGAVIAMMLVETATTVDECAWVYFVTVTKFLEGIEVLNLVPVMLPIHNCLLFVTTAICQGYLALRFLKLSKNWWIFAFLALLSAAAQSMAIYVSYLDLTHTQFSERLEVFHAGETWFALEAATDILIALALVAYLLKFRQKTTFSNTKGVLERLVVLSIESGTTTAALALTIIISAVLAPKTNWCVLFLFVLGRSYAITFLFNLNIRAGSSISGFSSSDGKGGVISSQGVYGAYSQGQSQQHPTFRLAERSGHGTESYRGEGGVGVQRTTHVHIESIPPTGSPGGGYNEKARYQGYNGAHVAELDRDMV